jgi:hypothetical protein
MNYPGSKDREVYTEIINDIFQKQISTSIMQDLLERTIEQHHAAQIMAKLVPVVEGTVHGVLPSLISDVDQFVAKMRVPPAVARELTPCNFSVEELITSEISDVGLSWPLQSLTKAIGGAKRKTVGIIYAFVDTGKTSFGLSCCAHFARQMVGTMDKIVYAGNEEGGSRIALRLTQAITGRTRKEILEDPQGTSTLRTERGWNSICLYDSVSHIATVERLLERNRPRILFIDQGTKVSTDLRTDNEIHSAQYLFNWYRERAKLYDVSIICLAQATGESENRKYLKLSDIYGSRVAIQGELDYAVGIGRTLDDLSMANLRFFSVPKNKLNEGEGARFTAEFTRERCIYREV